MTHDARHMIRRRIVQIGFSQRVRLEWLEKTANLVLAGNDDASIKGVLQELLENKLSVGGNAKRGNREKVITILMKIWVRPPIYLYPLLREGLKLLSYLPYEYHIAVHWGMTMAVYPFWGSVAAHVGRLLRLQGKASHAQARRRIIEQYGQRPTVKDAVRRVLRSMVDWGVIKDAKTYHSRRSDGTYEPGLTLTIAQVELIAWLVEAFLLTNQSGSADLRSVLDSTSLFPFYLEHIPAVHLANISERLEVFRHGLNKDLIMLRTATLPTAK
jgi:hypothetical protein